jgi:hypothetical protein
MKIHLIILNESSLKLNNNLKEFIETKIENLKKELKKEIIESNKSNINIENRYIPDIHYINKLNQNYIIKKIRNNYKN